MRKRLLLEPCCFEKPVNSGSVGSEENSLDFFKTTRRERGDRMSRRWGDASQRKKVTNLDLFHFEYIVSQKENANQTWGVVVIPLAPALRGA